MPDLKILAPCCDNEVTITQRDILRGALHRNETGGKILVGCPECSTALAMAEDMPLDTPLFNEWVITHQEDSSWLPCIKLTDAEIREPVGSFKRGGRTTYKAGDGSEELTRAAYMMRYATDPEKAWAKTKAAPKGVTIG